jgi:hypothetical protein
MANEEQDEDGVEELEGADLKKAMKRLGRGPMRFAFGCKEGNVPVLLMHPTKSAKALSQKLRSELGATKTTHGTASADGKAVVLDVEGPKVNGMGRMVKTLLRKECVGKYTQARVRIGGQEEAEEADEGGEASEGEGEVLENAINPELRALYGLRERLQASERDVAAILPRIGQGHAEDRAVLLAYCRDSAELLRGSQDCGDPELSAYGQSCAARARKLAGYLKGGGGHQPNGGGCEPSSSISGSVGKGGANKRPDVALVQSLLAQKGYGVAADGLCGPATISAIVAFQKASTGKADGLVEPGKNTWRALTGQALVQPNYGPGYGPGNGGGYGKPKPPPGYKPTPPPGYKPTPPPGYGKPTPPGYATPEGGGRRWGLVEEELGNKGGHEDFPHYGVSETSVEGESMKGSGSVYSEKTADGEIEILGGQYESDGTNVSASGAILRHKYGGTTDTLGAAEYKRGVFTDGDGWWAGEKASMTDAKREVDFTQDLGLNENLVLKGDVAAGTASVEASISDQGLAVGAQANAAEASATVGSTGTGDQDQSVRFGVSEGVGMAGRVHWGDADKDGNPEYGVGADFGPVSFDVKTEDPLRMAFQNSGGPITQAASELYDGNMTNDAMSAAADAGQEIGGWFSGDGEA